MLDSTFALRPSIPEPGSSVLITGAAGFIGFHMAKLCIGRGHRVVGLDNVNSYYDPTLKEARIALLQREPGFSFLRTDLLDAAGLDDAFAYRPDYIVHLAAQAGVRYSLENPRAYVDSNMVGFLNILESCRRYPVKHLVYASTSSVYGADTKLPFSVHQGANHPLTLYAATKKANEMMAHCYSHLFAIPSTGLRFFTVYGPWGRPDMALFKFTKSILSGVPIDVYNFGRHKRDFTYVDDVVEGVYRTMFRPPAEDPAWSGDEPDPASSRAPFRLYNIGNNQPVELLDYIRVLEEKLGRKAVINLLPLQPGDLPDTMADVTDLMRDTGFRPATPIEVGLGRFVDWYLDYYRPTGTSTITAREGRARPAGL